MFRKSSSVSVLAFNKEHRGSLFLACEGIHQDFRGKQAMLSPRYTTRWNELLVVKA
ncbi:DNA polymerase V [Escherichia coli]|nr:DUF4113 domain-containing protein [Escherichia coli]PPV51900.1 DNA polymerase V [Escherichia coli]